MKKFSKFIILCFIDELALSRSKDNSVSPSQYKEDNAKLRQLRTLVRKPIRD